MQFGRVEVVMPNVAKMRRVLYRHDWSSLDEWVEALGELADCSDEAVDEVVRSVHREPDDVYFE
jgi:hypothetical protein